MNNLKLAIKSIFANPVRSGLTILGVIIGIATVILVLSAGEGFKGFIDSQVQAYGSNTLFIETRVPPTTRNRESASVTQADHSRALSAVAITTLKNRDIEDIKRLPNIDGAYGLVVGQKVASYEETAKNIFVYGASAERFDIDQGTLKSGRFYTVQEDRGAVQVAILGSKIASDLFGETPAVGKLLRIGDLNFEVVGVYEERGSFGGFSEDEIIYVPLVTAQKKLLGIDHLLMIVAQMRDPNIGDATAEDIRIILRENHDITDPVKDDFIAQTQSQALDTFNTIFNGITALLIAISAISLIVGGVGIMNIMYVAVTERTAEIGLKKALGARESDILSEFLASAVLITVFGGIIGLLFGAFLGFLVSLIASASNLDWQFTVPLYAIVLAFGISASIGIGFGVFPARSASKLDPIEALRHE